MLTVTAWRKRKLSILGAAQVEDSFSFSCKQFGIFKELVCFYFGVDNRLPHIQ